MTDHTIPFNAGPLVRHSTVEFCAVFSDYSGVVASLRVSGYHFSGTYIGGDPRVEPVSSRRGGVRVPKKFIDIATRDFQRILDGLPDGYREKCAELYA